MTSQYLRHPRSENALGNGVMPDVHSDQSQKDVANCISHRYRISILFKPQAPAVPAEPNRERLTDIELNAKFNPTINDFQIRLDNGWI